ncbi:MAG: ABC transporter permease [Lacipirellulaceae bacterium]
MSEPTEYAADASGEASFLERGWVRVVAPIAIGLLALVAWEAAVRWWGAPEYLLPAPSRIAQTLVAEWRELFGALAITVRTMLSALALAVVGGVGLALLFTLSRVLEVSLFPYAVVLQVTPLIAVAPLINVWLGDYPWLVLLACAWIVAFFPILSNTVVGLHSADHNLRDLMRLYGATPWQRVRLLLAPAALPYFLAGLKVAANLSLVGAVVAEFAVGTASGQTGLASVILECGYRLEAPTMFAALVLVSATGVVTYFLIHLLSQWLLSPWHDSAVRREG